MSKLLTTEAMVFRHLVDEYLSGMSLNKSRCRVRDGVQTPRSNHAREEFILKRRYTMMDGFDAKGVKRLEKSFNVVGGL